MRRATCTAAVLFSLAAAAPASAPAQPVESFYEGKTITFVIAGPPAGAYDVYARLAGRYLGKYLGGNPSVVPRNMPGAGGLIAANYVFNVAPRDGTVLAMLVPTFPLEEELGLSAAKYKASRFTWIGRMAELGVRVGSRLQLLRGGSPCLLQVDGSRLSLRNDWSTQILVRPVACGH